MQSKSIIVIGAGMAGLAAGCYGQMNGYRSHIFEQHSVPGGLCTAWKRKGYTFDGCLHWLVGSGEGKMMNRMWKELGALEGKRVYDFDTFYVWHSPDGSKAFHCYTDLDRLENEALRLSPEDRPIIDEIMGALRTLLGVSQAIGALESGNVLQKAASLPRLAAFPGLLKKWDNVTIGGLRKRFKDPFLARVFPGYFPDSMGAFFFLFTLAGLADKNAGLPEGGSLEFARRIEGRYLGLGGEITYGARVEKILVEGDRAVGVRLADGTEHRADWVVSAADGYTTLYKMLEGRYLSPEVEQPYKEGWEIFKSCVQVSYGLDMDLSGQPRSQAFELEAPLMVGDEAVNVLALNHFCHDASFAPAGKSVATVLMMSDFRPWQALLEQGREAYEARKDEIAKRIADELDRRIPGFKDAVEVVDVVTPHTFIRYTSNWQGSIQGWMVSPGKMSFDEDKDVIPHTLPGLDGFFMSGQWVSPGGGVPVAGDGKKVIQRVCKVDGRGFKTMQ